MQQNPPVASEKMNSVSKHPNILPALAACALLSGCVMANQPAEPAIAEPPRAASPEPLAVLTDTPPQLVPFLAAGCVIERDAHPPALDCRAAREIHSFGCLYGTDLLFIDSSFASLRYPIAECRLQLGDSDLPVKARGIVRLGCMVPLYRRYVIARGGRFSLARTAGDLAAVLRPIESEAAALAFATAVTPAIPLAALPERRELLVPRFEPTRVDRTSDGFDVQLFEEQRCGCGPHPTFVLTVHVQRDGAVTIHDKKAAFRDRSTTCVD